METVTGFLLFFLESTGVSYRDISFVVCQVTPSLFCSFLNIKTYKNAPTSYVKFSLYFGNVGHYVTVIYLEESSLLLWLVFCFTFFFFMYSHGFEKSWRAKGRSWGCEIV